MEYFINSRFTRAMSIGLYGAYCLLCNLLTAVSTGVAHNFQHIHVVYFRHKNCKTLDVFVCNATPASTVSCVKLVCFTSICLLLSIILSSMVISVRYSFQNPHNTTKQVSNAPNLIQLFPHASGQHSQQHGLLPRASGLLC